MKKISFILASFLIFSTVSAQVVNLSGSWKLNASKSKLGEQFSMAPSVIIITQGPNELNIEKHTTFQDQESITKDKLTLDGKECVNPGWQDSQKKSTVSVSEDKKSITISSKFPINDGNELLIKEVYKMEGSNMVLQSSSTSSFGDMNETMVYDKQ